MRTRIAVSFGAGIVCCALFLVIALGILVPFRQEAGAQEYGAWQTLDRVYDADQWNRGRTADLDRWIQNMSSDCDIRTIVTADSKIMVYYRCLE